MIVCASVTAYSTLALFTPQLSIEYAEAEVEAKAKATRSMVVNSILTCKNGSVDGVANIGQDVSMNDRSTVGFIRSLWTWGCLQRVNDCSASAPARAAYLHSYINPVLQIADKRHIAGSKAPKIAAEIDGWTPKSGRAIGSRPSRTRTSGGLRSCRGNVCYMNDKAFAVKLATKP